MAILRVQGNKQGTANSGNHIDITLDSVPIAGNVLVLAFGSLSAPANLVTSITQVGVTWTQQIRNAGLVNIDCEIWFGVVGAGASADLIVTFNQANGWWSVADVCEYSGVLTVGFLDQTATASVANPDTTLLTGTTAVTTQADELWVGAILNVGGGASVQSNPTNGFTLLDGLLVLGQVSLAYLEKIVAATGAANSGTTTLANTGGANGAIATFKGLLGSASKRLLRGTNL